MEWIQLKVSYIKIAQAIYHWKGNLSKHVLWPKRHCWLVSGPSCFFHNPVRKEGLDTKEKNQVKFLKVFLNPLWYYFQKSLFYALVKLLTKIKKGSGTSSWCTFSAYLKKVLIWYSINWLSFYIRTTFLLKVWNNMCFLNYC